MKFLAWNSRRTALIIIIQTKTIVTSSNSFLLPSRSITEGLSASQLAIIVEGLRQLNSSHCIEVLKSDLVNIKHILDQFVDVMYNNREISTGLV